ncbi:MAG: hypothetical protein K2X50_05810 [Gammaproteobacteria bacterium]|nr:hypothetical protein [Gammaproteobacteria bacterium]
MHTATENPSEKARKAFQEASQAYQTALTNAQNTFGPGALPELLLTNDEQFKKTSSPNMKSTLQEQKKQENNALATLNGSLDEAVQQNNSKALLDLQNARTTLANAARVAANPALASTEKASLQIVAKEKSPKMQIVDAKLRSGPLKGIMAAMDERQARKAQEKKANEAQDVVNDSNATAAALQAALASGTLSAELEAQARAALVEMETPEADAEDSHSAGGQPQEVELKEERESSVEKEARDSNQDIMCNGHRIRTHKDGSVSCASVQGLAEYAKTQGWEDFKFNRGTPEMILEGTDAMHENGVISVTMTPEIKAKFDKQYQHEPWFKSHEAVEASHTETFNNTSAMDRAEHSAYAHSYVNLVNKSPDATEHREFLNGKGYFKDSDRADAIKLLHKQHAANPDLVKSESDNLLKGLSEERRAGIMGQLDQATQDLIAAPVPPPRDADVIAAAVEPDSPPGPPVPPRDRVAEEAEVSGAEMEMLFSEEGVVESNEAEVNSEEMDMLFSEQGIVESPEETKSETVAATRDEGGTGEKGKEEKAEPAPTPIDEKPPELGAAALGEGLDTQAPVPGAAPEPPKQAQEEEKKSAVETSTSVPSPQTTAQAASTIPNPQPPVQKQDEEKVETTATAQPTAQAHEEQNLHTAAAQQTVQAQEKQKVDTTAAAQQTAQAQTSAASTPSPTATTSTSAVPKPQPSTSSQAAPSATPTPAPRPNWTNMGMGQTREHLQGANQTDNKSNSLAGVINRKLDSLQNITNGKLEIMSQYLQGVKNFLNGPENKTQTNFTDTVAALAVNNPSTVPAALPTLSSPELREVTKKISEDERTDKAEQALQKVDDNFDDWKNNHPKKSSGKDSKKEEKKEKDQQEQKANPNQQNKDPNQKDNTEVDSTKKSLEDAKKKVAEAKKTPQEQQQTPQAPSPGGGGGHK